MRSQEEDNTSWQILERFPKKQDINSAWKNPNISLLTNSHQQILACFFKNNDTMKIKLHPNQNLYSKIIHYNYIIQIEYLNYEPNLRE